MAATVTANIKLPIALINRLEHVRLIHAERMSRVPRLRELIVEVVQRFVDEEAGSAQPAPAGSDYRLK